MKKKENDLDEEDDELINAEQIKEEVKENIREDKIEIISPIHKLDYSIAYNADKDKFISPSKFEENKEDVSYLQIKQDDTRLVNSHRGNNNFNDNSNINLNSHNQNSHLLNSNLNVSNFNNLGDTSRVIQPYSINDESALGKSLDKSASMDIPRLLLDDKFNKEKKGAKKVKFNSENDNHKNNNKNKDIFSFKDAQSLKSNKKVKDEKDKKSINSKAKNSKISKNTKNSKNAKKKENEAHIVHRNPSNAFVPYLVGRNRSVYLTLMFKIILIILICLTLIYLISHFLILVRNQGGNVKAIFWVILAAISIAENYLIFLPFLCLLKAMYLFSNGNYHPITWSWSIRNVLSVLIITDADRAIFKELIECVKNNTNNTNEKILTSQVLSSITDLNITDENEKPEEVGLMSKKLNKEDKIEDEPITIEKKLDLSDVKQINEEKISER